MRRAGAGGLEEEDNEWIARDAQRRYRLPLEEVPLVSAEGDSPWRPGSSGALLATASRCLAELAELERSLGLAEKDSTCDKNYCAEVKDFHRLVGSSPIIGNSRTIR